MTDYTKVCWYCGSGAVFPIETWFGCQDCEATYVPQLAGSFSPATEVDANTGGPPRPGGATRYRPSGRAMRKAKEAREAKG